MREVIEAARVVTNRPVPVTEGPRRAGDAVALVFGSDRARAERGWLPERSTLPQKVADARAWHQASGSGA